MLIRVNESVKNLYDEKHLLYRRQALIVFCTMLDNLGKTKGKFVNTVNYLNINKLLK